MDQKIECLIVHNVGNKLIDEPIHLSNSLIEVSSEMEITLKKYFLNSIRKDEYFKFQHESEMNLNEVYTYAYRIFKDRNNFIEDSRNIAKHLYKYSEHPKIKGGDLFIVYFSNYLINDESVDAIGIFKSENKDTFIKVKGNSDKLDLLIESGANVNKLDKGCIIYNLENKTGFLVSIIDNLSRSGSEARYWKDDFLYVRHRKDEYYNTQNILSLCKNFVTLGISEKLNLSKADQVDFLNKSVEYFKKNGNFDKSEFEKEVIGEPEIIDNFNQYKSEYEQTRELAILDNFVISESAVKKQARSLKSIIKLDKNFHIYVHGDRDMIEQGIDDEGRKYYKIYYKQEC